MLFQELYRILKIVVSGEGESENVRVYRLVLSIRQDICRGATNCKWAMHKHILIFLTLRHMSQNNELLTILNRFGHCEIYSFSLELEIAIAKSVQESTSLLLQSIVCNHLPGLFYTKNLTILIRL